MDFKLNEVSKLLFDQGAWKSVLVVFIYQIILGFIIGFAFVAALIGTVGFEDNIATADFGIGVILVLMLFSLIALFLTPYFTAGLMGSTEEIRKGRAFSLNLFFNEASARYGKTLGGMFLYMVAVFALVIVGAIFLVLLGDPEGTGLVSLIGMFIMTFVVMLFSPIVYTASLSGGLFETFGRLYRENFAELAVIFIVVVVVSFIPLLSIFASFLFMVFPVYLVVLLVDEPVVEFEEKDDEESADEDSISIEKE